MNINQIRINVSFSDLITILIVSWIVLPLELFVITESSVLCFKIFCKLIQFSGLSYEYSSGLRNLKKKNLIRLHFHNVLRWKLVTVTALRIQFNTYGKVSFIEALLTVFLYNVSKILSSDQAVAFDISTKFTPFHGSSMMMLI